MLCPAMMLENRGRQVEAKIMRDAIDQVLCEDKIRTGDLGGTASTRNFTKAIIRRLR